MTSNKKPVALLVDILIKKGLKYLIHSPGSRNAPLVIAFSRSKKVKIITCVDERSAAFYAMGLALETGNTVAIDCTSGTAALNYGPAIAEAFYQHIPLLVLTADRSPEHVNIGDGQTINQKNMFTNYVKESYTLPISIDSQDNFLHAELLTNKAFDITTLENPGPVHINIPIDEPLYGQSNDEPNGKEIMHMGFMPNPINKLPQDLVEQLSQCTRVMIIAGQMMPDQKTNSELKKLTQQKEVVVLTETTSNLAHPEFIDGIDNVISTFDVEDSKLFAPEILITFGGAVVSKMIKTYLRKYPPDYHWHISLSGAKRNTYFCLTDTIKGTPLEIIQLLNNQKKGSSTQFKSSWLNRKNIVSQKKENYLQQIDYSDLQIFNHILNHLPLHVNLHLGNSTPVRYAQLFGSNPSINYYSNRGVSGIDGQISTASGIATASQKKLNVLITGDLGFLYDSNGLLLLQHCPNLKIIVINNQGGGIFRFIPGPDTVNGFEQYFEAQHQLSFKHLAIAYNIKYLRADNLQKLTEKLPLLFKNNTESIILEVNTPAVHNAEVLRNYFKALK